MQETQRAIWVWGQLPRLQAAQQVAAGLDPSGAGQLALALGMAPYAVNRLLATPQGQAYLRNQVMGLGPEYFGQQQGLLRVLGGFGQSQQ